MIFEGFFDWIADSIAPVTKTHSSEIDMTSSLNGLKFLAISLCGASIALGTGLSSASHAQIEATAAGAVTEQVAQGAPSIVDIATSAGAFDTLVTALQAADLVDALSGEGPLTVFAPIDEAFDALPAGVLDALLEPENKDLLTQVLVYHVVEGGVLSSDLSTGDVETLAGNLMVDVSTDGVMVNDAQVLRADVQGSNGVIHVIDQVLVPESVATELANRLAADDAEPMAADDMAADDMAIAESDAAVFEAVEPVEPAATAEAPMLDNAVEEPEFSSTPVSEPVRGLW